MYGSGFVLTLVDLVAGVLVVFTILKGLYLALTGWPGLISFWITNLGRGAVLWGGLVVFRCAALVPVVGAKTPGFLWILFADLGKACLCIVLRRWWRMR